MFIQEDAFQIVVWKMAAILSRPQCDNPLSGTAVFGPALLIWSRRAEMPVDFSGCVSRRVPYAGFNWSTSLSSRFQDNGSNEICKRNISTALVTRYKQHCVSDASIENMIICHLWHPWLICWCFWWNAPKSMSSVMCLTARYLTKRQWSNMVWYNSVITGSGSLFIKRRDVSPLDLVKSRSHEIWVKTFPIAPKFDRHLDSSVAEMPVRF